MRSHYQISVSRNGQHLFSTSKDSLWTKDKAEALYDVLRIRFREEDGYKLSVTYWNCSGKEVKFR